jgi:hypothetical protein
MSPGNRSRGGTQHIITDRFYPNQAQRETLRAQPSQRQKDNSSGMSFDHLVMSSVGPSLTAGKDHLLCRPTWYVATAHSRTHCAADLTQGPVDRFERYRVLSPPLHNILEGDKGANPTRPPHISPWIHQNPSKRIPTWTPYFA